MKLKIQGGLVLERTTINYRGIDKNNFFSLPCRVLETLYEALILC
jgi:hypothetical protein